MARRAGGWARRAAGIDLLLAAIKGAHKVAGDDAPREAAEVRAVHASTRRTLGTALPPGQVDRFLVPELRRAIRCPARLAPRLRDLALFSWPAGPAPSAAPPSSPSRRMAFAVQVPVVVTVTPAKRSCTVGLTVDVRVKKLRIVLAVYTGRCQRGRTRPSSRCRATGFRRERR